MMSRREQRYYFFNKVNQSILLLRLCSHVMSSYIYIFFFENATTIFEFSFANPNETNVRKKTINLCVLTLVFLSHYLQFSEKQRIHLESTTRFSPKAVTISVSFETSNNRIIIRLLHTRLAQHSTIVILVMVGCLSYMLYYYEHVCCMAEIYVYIHT